MTVTDESKMDTQLDLFQKVSLRSDLLRKKARPKWTLAESNGKSIVHVKDVNGTMPLEVNGTTPIPYRLGCLFPPLSLHVRSIVRKKCIRKMGD